MSIVASLPMACPSRNSANRSSQTLALRTPKHQVKTVKTALEKHKLLSRCQKIQPCSSSPSSMLVPTSLLPEGNPTSQDQDKDKKHDRLSAVIDTLGMDVEIVPVSAPTPPSRKTDKAQTPLHAAVSHALNDLPKDLLPSLSLCPATLIQTLNASYNIYRPLLLLSPTTLAHPSWTTLLTSLDPHPHHKTVFFSTIAHRMRVTHIATNAPIPALSAPHTPNRLRSPANIHPLHPPSFASPQTRHETPLWVSAAQNAITQTWAPLHTMFSAGNTREKARLLHHPGVAAAVRQGRATGRGCAAVDLFAGVGYFAFSYAKAGVDAVLCWDLNGWSVEGLRRGAVANGWDVDVRGFSGEGEGGRRGRDVPRSRIVAFHEDNANAVGRIADLRGRGELPPVRHVNCGVLPTAEGAWGVAVEALDGELGGWLHLHESVREGSLDARVETVVAGVRGLARRGYERREVRLEEAVRVKSVGRRVVHVVLDVWVGGRGAAEGTSNGVS